MTENTIELFLPEYCPDNKYFFAKNADFVQSTPITFQNCTLWAILNSLDTITSSMTVVLTKTSGYSAELYRVVCNLPLSFTVPPLFEMTTISDKNVFYIPNDRFLQFEAGFPCVQVLNNEWAANEMRYHQIAAFYRLNIIPTLSQSVFSEKEHFEPMCNIFYDLYHVTAPLSNGLKQVFKNLFFAFQFFGFSFPKNTEEKESLEALTLLAKRGDEMDPSSNMLPNGPNTRLYAFTEMKWMINNFRKQCFPNDPLPEGIISPKMYHSIVDTVDFVKRTLAKLDLVPSGFCAEDALINAVRNFQAENNIPIGVCDMFTLRQIWNTFTSTNCDFLTLCKFCNMGSTATTKPLVFHENIKKVTTMYADPSVEALEKAFNDAITKIKTHNEAPEWLVGETEEAVKRHIERLDTTAKEAEDLEVKIEQIKAKLEQTTKSNIEVSKKFDEATQLVDSVIEEHSSMRDEFVQVKNRINDLHHGNQTLLIFVCLLAIVVLIRWIF